MCKWEKDKDEMLGLVEWGQIAQLGKRGQRGGQWANEPASLARLLSAGGHARKARKPKSQRLDLARGCIMTPVTGVVGKGRELSEGANGSQAVTSKSCLFRLLLRRVSQSEKAIAVTNEESAIRLDKQRKDEIRKTKREKTKASFRGLPLPIRLLPFVIATCDRWANSVPQFHIPQTHLESWKVEKLTKAEQCRKSDPKKEFGWRLG